LRRSSLNFRRANFAAFLAPPRRRAFRFSQGRLTVSEPQGGDAPEDVISRLMHPFRSEFSPRVEELPWPFTGVFQRTHKPMEFEDGEASLRLF
jgi:hypothetical protein